MSEDPASREGRQRSAKKPVPAKAILLGAVGAIALGAAGYMGYQYLAPKPATFNIKGVTHASVQDALINGTGTYEAPKPLRAEPSAAITVAPAEDPDMAEIIRQLEQPTVAAAGAEKADVGVAGVAVALGNSPDAVEPAAVLADPASAVPNDTPGNVALRQCMEKWERGAAEGTTGGVDLLSADFQRIVEASNLSCPSLYALGQSVGLVEGDKAAAVFYRVALSRVDQKITSQDGPRVRPTANALYGIAEAMMVKLKDYPTSERVYALLREYEAGDRIRWRKVTLCYADAMRLQGTAKAKASAEVLQGLLLDPLSADERREVGCALAQSLFDAGDYKAVADALANWETYDLAASNVNQGWELLIRAALKTGQADDARKTYAAWKQKAGFGRVLPLVEEEIGVSTGPK